MPSLESMLAEDPVTISADPDQGTIDLSFGTEDTGRRVFKCKPGTSLSSLIYSACKKRQAEGKNPPTGAGTPVNIPGVLFALTIPPPLEGDSSA